MILRESMLYKNPKPYLEGYKTNYYKMSSFKKRQ